MEAKKTVGLETVSRGRSFDDLLLETIDDVLKQGLGEEAAKVILRYMNKSVKWEENPERVEVFADALRKILGSGSAALENLILKSLCSKLELKFEEEKGHEFSDYVKELESQIIPDCMHKINVK